MDDGDEMLYLPKNQGGTAEAPVDNLAEEYRTGRHSLCNSVDKDKDTDYHKWALNHAVAQSCQKPKQFSQ